MVYNLHAKNQKILRAVLKKNWGLLTTNYGSDLIGSFATMGRGSDIPKPQSFTLNHMNKIFFSKFWPCHFFYFNNPKLHAIFQKNQWAISEKFKDGLTNGWTKDKGDYLRPCWVSQRSTMFLDFRKDTIYQAYYGPFWSKHNCKKICN